MLNKKANFSLSGYQVWLLKYLVEEHIRFLCDIDVKHNIEDDLLVILQCLENTLPENSDLQTLYFWVDIVDDPPIIYEK